MIKNARFWVEHKGSFVKLTLKDNQEVNTLEGGITDEGYDYTSTSYSYEDGRVFCSQVRDAKDCDGPMSWSWEGSFDAGSFQTRSAVVDMKMLDDYPWNEAVYDDSVQLPVWEKASHGQRDLYAELMGY